jgi:hypothetical protein
MQLWPVSTTGCGALFVNFPDATILDHDLEEDTFAEDVEVDSAVPAAIDHLYGC